MRLSFVVRFAEKRVREHFTIAKHCEKIMHIYDRVIKEAS